MFIYLNYVNIRILPKWWVTLPLKRISAYLFSELALLIYILFIISNLLMILALRLSDII